MNKSLLGTKESLANFKVRKNRSFHSWMAEVNSLLNAPATEPKKQIVTFNHPIMEQWNK